MLDLQRDSLLLAGLRQLSARSMTTRVSATMAAALLRRARPLSWAKTIERGALLPALTASEAPRRPFGTVNVILTDDVTGTGYRGEYVEIRGGFMRNFLFPAKRAIYATEENKLAYESVDRTPEKARAEALKTLKRGRQELSGIPIILKRHVPADGASPDQDVTAKEVSGYLRKNWQMEIEEAGVRMPRGQPISSLGQHSVMVRAILSEEARGILEEELGVQEFEKLAWVQMKVVVEKTRAKALREKDKGEEEEDVVDEGDLSTSRKL